MDENMKSLTNDELHKVIQLVQAEGAVWSGVTQINLLKRRVGQMLAERDYFKILAVIDPFPTREFDPFAPEVAALDETLKAKVCFLSPMHGEGDIVGICLQRALEQRQSCWSSVRSVSATMRTCTLRSWSHMRLASWMSCSVVGVVGWLFSRRPSTHP